MIAYTLEQAAARVFQDVDTITAWVASGHLVAVFNPIDGHRYVEESHLLDVERDVRREAAGTAPQAPPARPDPIPLTQLRQWLWDHGEAVTDRALRDWVETKTLRPVVPGARGRGNAALFDPMGALTVAVARRLHLVITHPG